MKASELRQELRVIADRLTELRRDEEDRGWIVEVHDALTEAELAVRLAIAVVDRRRD